MAPCCKSVLTIPMVVIFLLLGSILPTISLSEAVTNSTAPSTNKKVLKRERIAAQMRNLNKPSLKTIQSAEGELIDCVPTHLQPAFDHPKLKGHLPLNPPQNRPRGSSNSTRTKLESEILNSWLPEGESCPTGTVPIRRVTEKDLMMTTSFRRLRRRALVGRLGLDASDISNGHEYALASVTGNQYYGAKAYINVWEPRVAAPSETSISQIWIIAGSFEANELNSIEAGWLVNPTVFGDASLRFFTYWTSDAYKDTGCYNVDCSGFIQTSSRLVIGLGVPSLSTYNSNQYEYEILIWQDQKTGDWWLNAYGETVGYWPASIFTKLGSSSGDRVDFGGEVFNSWPSGGHTSTMMGSGKFPGEGFGKASYIRDLQVVDSSNTLVRVPLPFKTTVTNPNCYDLVEGTASNWGNYFFYGGPGLSEGCP